MHRHNHQPNQDTDCSISPESSFVPNGKLAASFRAKLLQHQKGLGDLEEACVCGGVLGCETSGVPGKGFFEPLEPKADCGTSVSLNNSKPIHSTSMS